MTLGQSFRQIKTIIPGFWCSSPPHNHFHSHHQRFASTRCGAVGVRTWWRGSTWRQGRTCPRLFKRYHQYCHHYHHNQYHCQLGDKAGLVQGWKQHHHCHLIWQWSWAFRFYSISLGTIQKSVRWNNITIMVIDVIMALITKVRLGIVAELTNPFVRSKVLEMLVLQVASNYYSACLCNNYFPFG